MDIGKSALRFVSSAAMWPSQLRIAYPGAQFVARARVPAGSILVDDYFSPFIEEDVWGIVLALPGDPARDLDLTATADDGRALRVVSADDVLLQGDPEQVLAAARYWELAPAFVRQLRAALQAGGITIEDEEPRDDGNLG